MKNVNIHIPKKLSVTLSALLLALLPIGLFFIVEFGYNQLLSFWNRMSVSALVINYVWFAFLVLFTYCVFPHPRISLIVLTLLTLIYSVINHFVTELKGMPITINDFRALKTAMAVMGDYEYVPDLLLFKSLIVAAGVILGIILFIKPLKITSTRGKIIKYSIGAASAVCLVLLSLNMNHFLTDVSDSELDVGDMNYAYEVNGYIPVTLSGISSLKVEEPEEYGAEIVRDMLLKYDTPKHQTISKERPMIIGIMNEAFSDLSVLGPVENQEKIFDYLYSLKGDPNTIAWGSCLVSVRGTGTANTEFEFLTGDSLRYIGNVCPYNYYSMRDVPNLASNLKAEGYHAIAMHPESATNWRRNGVYPEFGFDEFLSYADYAGYDTISYETDEVNNTDNPKKAGGRVSDLGDYKKLIDVLEMQNDPTFLFNVTMQNHSGYSKLHESVLNHPADSDPILNADDESSTYETLMALSDDALEYLVEYLREYKKPVILVLFGDHQPDLPDEVEDALMSRSTNNSQLAKNETKYMTSYFIWSNYSTGIKYDSSDIVSANYLGAMVRNAAGLHLTAFEKYMLAQREEIPAMNRFGYLGTDGIWHNYDEENLFSDWLNHYELIQYNNLFDKENNQIFFHVDE